MDISPCDFPRPTPAYTVTTGTINFSDLNFVSTPGSDVIVVPNPQIQFGCVAPGDLIQSYCARSSDSVSGFRALRSEVDWEAATGGTLGPAPVDFAVEMILTYSGWIGEDGTAVWSDALSAVEVTGVCRYSNRIQVMLHQGHDSSTYVCVCPCPDRPIMNYSCHGMAVAVPRSDLRIEVITQDCFAPLRN